MRVKIMIVEMFHMYSREKNRRKKKRNVHWAKRRRELKLNIMPGIKRNYPRYTSIISFMEFRRQPQRTKGKRQEMSRRRETETR